MMIFTTALALLAAVSSVTAAPNRLELEERSELAPRKNLHARLQSKLGDNLCVGVSRSGPEAPMVLQKCDKGSTSILFDDGWAMLWLWGAGDQFVADVPHGNYHNGAKPHAVLKGWSSNGKMDGTPQQKWQRFSFQTGISGNDVDYKSWHHIRAQNSAGFCLDIKDGQAREGAQVQIWSCVPNSNNQQFRFINLTRNP